MANPVKYAAPLFLTAMIALFPTAGNPQSRIKTNSKNSITKLSPDLRRTASAKSDQPVIVVVLIDRGTDVNGLMLRSAVSRPLGNLQWITGTIVPAKLEKLAAIPGVLSVTSTETFRPHPTPGLGTDRLERPRLSAERARAIAKEGGKAKLIEALDRLKENTKIPKGNGKPALATGMAAQQPESAMVRNVHNAPLAWAKGYTGQGVTAAMVDTGVGFGHPDLQGTQARVGGGVYAGWPFSYDAYSAVSYVLAPSVTIGPDTYWNMDVTSIWYCHTIPVTGASCAGNTCSGNLKIDYGTDAGWFWDPVILPFTWPNTSVSGNYRYTVHPDFNLYQAASVVELGYAGVPDLAPPAVLLVDETTPGVYDTVYVDTDCDQDFSDEKPMRKGDELAGADIFDAGGNMVPDGVWDLSAGLLAWISDGVNPPPGLSVVYPGQANIPAAGHLIIFVGDEDGHGTSGAGEIAAQGIITDPELWANINPLFAGGANAGGVGGPVLSGMAPAAKIAAFQNGFIYPLDSWTLAALGFDGIPSSGDEAQLVNNSWGTSDIIEDGWDPTSRFLSELNAGDAPNTLFLASTGNGGHGYGTVASPDGGSILGVGASTLYGTLSDFELVPPAQFTFGDISPWSNRGPTMIGDLSPHIVAVGAWGTGAFPLNANLFYYAGTDEYILNGQAAYDTFGGTSMASPVAAGILALIYQAFHDANGRWPTWEEAAALAMNGARDLGYEVLSQGAGNLDADRSTDMAANDAWTVTPASWVAGDYQGTEHGAFPSVAFPGDSKSKQFTISNPATDSINVNLEFLELQQVHETVFDLPLPGGDAAEFDIPTYLQEITSDIATYDPDLVRGQIVFPYSSFDTGGDYIYDNRWRLLFYDWTDNNSDGNLWTDDNTNGVVDSTEIDIDSTTGIYEYIRFTYAYPSGTCCEASVGRNSLSRRHNGVFFGLQRRGDGNPNYSGPPMTLKVRITYYKRQSWSWLSATPTSLAVPAGSNANFNATLAIPPSQKPGVYEGIIRATAGSDRTVIPVIVNVASNSATFGFGSSTLADAPTGRPYENGHLLGGFTWDWRYENGDWRLLYYDVPTGQIYSGRSVIIDTTWRNVPTDIDTWVYGPSPDSYSSSDPALFGPSGTELLSGSTDTWDPFSTLFKFQTASGGARETVGAELKAGLNTLILHNVLYSGDELHEPFVGRSFEVQVTPPTVNETGPSGDWTQTFLTRGAIPEGIQVQAYGLSQPINLPSEPVLQDDTTSVTSASWVYPLDLLNCGVLGIDTQGPADLDIDLYVYRDGGNGTWDHGADEVEIAGSLTYEAEESIELMQPVDGRYWVLVHGYTVPNPPRQFSIRIRAVQGNDLVPSGLPAGGIAADAPVSFNVSWSNATPEPWEGLLLLGPSYAPSILQVPVFVVGVSTTPSKHWSLYR